MSTIQLHGSRTLQVRREEIWPLIFNPKSLMFLIPGCEELRQISENEYEGIVSVGFAGISGRYATNVRIIEIDPPEHCRFEGEVIGNTGIIKGEADFQIKEEDHTSVISYIAAAIITGALSKISPRFIEGVVNSLIKHGLEACEKKFHSAQVDLS